tara:strand:+ start:227 stop:616 length:390 start_codon:yes stop_codon:yes gene_type:complete
LQLNKYIQSLKKENIMKFESKFLTDLFTSIESAFENSEILYDDLKSIKINKDGDNYIAEINPPKQKVLCRIDGGILSSVASEFPLDIEVLDSDVQDLDHPEMFSFKGKDYYKYNSDLSEVLTDEEKTIF